MSLDSYSIGIIALVALVSLVLTILTWMGAQRTGQRKVRFIAGAFGIHFVKSALAAMLLYVGTVPHEFIQIMEAMMDLSMVTLLFIPFWTPP